LKEVILSLENEEESRDLFGQYDNNLKLIEASFPVKIVARGREITIRGEAGEVYRTQRLFSELLIAIRSGHILRSPDLKYAIRMIKDDPSFSLQDLVNSVIQVTPRGKQIKPKTTGQKKYVEAIRKFDIVFSIGPAGTGKTYLAMAMAISALASREISRIILVRPAVEAGEKLGFLPGDLQQKVDPYLRPLYDAIYDMMEVDRFQKYMERGIIEVAPLAFMRGRTLNDAFIILDEAQNTTPEQMKMFLTRLGFGSKAVITGDITQIDLPSDKYSGLLQARDILKGVEGIEFVHLTGKDVVRHELVQKIIRAYENYENSRKKSPPQKEVQINVK